MSSLPRGRSGLLAVECDLVVVLGSGVGIVSGSGGGVGLREDDVWDGQL